MDDKFKINERVFSPKLGMGVVVVDQSNLLPGTVRVKWDKKPDVMFNGGVNPCLVPANTLSISTSECQQNDKDDSYSWMSELDNDWDWDDEDEDDEDDDGTLPLPFFI